jgi:hypothetical protein
MSNASTISQASNSNVNPAAVVAAAPAPQPPQPQPPQPLPIFVPMPPPVANIPDVPDGFQPIKGGFARGVKPRKAEMAVMPDAVTELAAFPNYAAAFGGSVPSQADAVQTLGASSQWTVMRVKSRAWDRYASNEEGVSWTATRSVMDRLKIAWLLAVGADPGLPNRYPKLAALFGAKKTIAKKGVSTRAANKKEKAAGQEPTHGVVAQRKAAKAAKAAAAAAKAGPPAATATQTPPPTAGTAVHTEPAPAPVVVPATTNGAAHS